MPTFNVEIDGLILIKADSKEDAFEKVKEMFYDEILSIDDLHLSCDDENED